MCSYNYMDIKYNCIFILGVVIRNGIVSWNET